MLTPVTEIKPRCATCPYAKAVNPTTSICMRYPPTPYLEQSLNPITKQVEIRPRAHWPAVGNEDFCGEHPLMAVNRFAAIDVRLGGEMKGAA